MPTIAEVMGTPEFQQLAQILADRKKQAENPDTPPEAKAAAATEYAELKAKFDLLCGGIEQQAREQAGDEIRRELEAAAQRDRQGGKFVFEGGRSYSPGVHKVAGALEYICPVPERAAQNAIGRAVAIPSADPALKELQQANDAMLLIRSFTKKDPRSLPQAKALWDGAVQRAAIMDGQTATTGGDWVPTYFSADLIESLYLAPTLTGLLRRFPMAGATVNVPRLNTRPTAYRASGATDSLDWGVPSSEVTNITTGKVTFDAELANVLVGYNNEIVEDSIVAIAPILREEVVLAMALGIEEAVINGSTSMSDLDNQNGTVANKLWTTTRDIRSAWDGLRKDAMVTTSCTEDAGGTGAFSSTDLLAIKRLMGAYGTAAQRSNLVWVMGVDAENLCLGLTEMKTLESYGPNFSFLSGEVGRMWGIPAITSGAVYGPGQGNGLNATGYWDNTTKTTASMLLVNRAAYWLGDRREVTIETDRSIVAGMEMIVATWRGDFQKTYASTAKSCGVIYNIVP